MKIEEVTQLLKRGHFSSPQQIREIIFLLKDVYTVPSLIMNQGNILYRARLINDIRDIHDTSDLSYTPSKYNKYYKRASTPDNTMFYGMSGDTHENMVCGCLGEVCNCFRNANPIYQHYKIIIGIWETTRDFTLPQIINPDGLNKSEAFGYSLEYRHLVRAFGYKSSQVMDFQRLINSEFTKQVKNEEEYWISAIFTEWILSLNDSYDGIIYESVQSTDSKLINNHCVAFKPQVADNFLKFRDALLLEFDYTGSDVKIPTPKRISVPLAK